MTQAHVHIDYYTDPLCSWSWALEPWLRWLRWSYGDQIAWRLRLGAMLGRPTRPEARQARWAPEWFSVGRQTGMPIEPGLWKRDPPSESISACLAVAAASLQGDEIAARYLRRLREVAVLGQLNIARAEVRRQVAAEVPGLDIERFEQALCGQDARALLRSDLFHVRCMRLTRFPALVIAADDVAEPDTRAVNSRRILIVGWRDRQALVSALEHIAPDLRPRDDVGDVDAFLDAIDRGLTIAELALIFSKSYDDARSYLEQRVNTGQLTLAPGPESRFGLFLPTPGALTVRRSEPRAGVHPDWSRSAP